MTEISLIVTLKKQFITVGIPMGTNCAPLIADLFLYCYERDFTSELHKSKRHDPKDMFNDTSRYLDHSLSITLNLRNIVAFDVKQQISLIHCLHK